MNIKKEEALELWDELYLKEEEAYDYASHPMKREDYENKDSIYGWTIELKQPNLTAGKNAIDNYIPASIVTNGLRENKTSFRIGSFIFEVRKGKRYGEYYIYDITNKNNPINMEPSDENQEPEYNKKRRNEMSGKSFAKHSEAQDEKIDKELKVQRLTEKIEKENYKPTEEEVKQIEEAKVAEEEPEPIVEEEPVVEEKLPEPEPVVEEKVDDGNFDHYEVIKEEPIIEEEPEPIAEEEPVIEEKATPIVEEIVDDGSFDYYEVIKEEPVIEEEPEPIVEETPIVEPIVQKPILEVKEEDDGYYYSYEVIKEEPVEEPATEETVEMPVEEELPPVIEESKEVEEVKEEPSYEYIVEMKNITRVFGTLVANDDVTLQLKKGEVHALLGENGAGKSTLMSILFGLYPPTSGTIYVRGVETQVKDPNHATSLGIGMVHQHFMLVEKYTALQNIVLGVEDVVFKIFITYKKAREKITKLMNQYNLQVDLDCPISDMSVGMQQKVEILKMLYRDSEILIFDEPTAVLTEMEIEELMKIIKTLKAQGKAILFISHKLNEVREISDRVTVLRKGKYIGTYNTADYDNEGLAELMVGKRVNFKTDKTEANPGEVVLDIQNLSVKKAGSKKLAVDDFTLQVRRGEIIAVAGIDGNGQDELVAAITGLTKAQSGSITLNNTDITKLKIKKRNQLGVNHVPGDRHKYGLVLDYNVMYNMVLENVSSEDFSKCGFLKSKSINRYSDDLVEKYDVRSSMGSYTITRGMSGGNQQKVIVAREIERHGDLLIAVQPTRGLDVGAIENIHKQIVKVRDSNKAVLLVSLEIDEVFNLADTIYTIYEGRITGKFKPAETTFKEIGLYETGAACQDEYRRKNTGSIEDDEPSNLTPREKRRLEKERRKQEKLRLKQEQKELEAEFLEDERKKKELELEQNKDSSEEIVEDNSTEEGGDDNGTAK